MQRFALRLNRPLKGLHHILRHIGKGKRHALKLRTLLIHPGEINQLVGQPGQPRDLTLDVIQPFAFAAFQLNQVCVGADDGEGRLDFVPCVGDEPALFVVALRRRGDNPSGEDEQQHQNRHKPEQGDDQARQQHRPEGGKASVAVEKNEPDAAVFRAAEKTVLRIKTAASPGGIYFPCIFCRSALIHCGDFVGVRAEHLTAFIQQHGEEARLVGRFVRKTALAKHTAVCSLAARRVSTGISILRRGQSLRKCALIRRQYG